MWKIASVGILTLWLTSTFALADAVTDFNLFITYYKQQNWKRATATCEEFIRNYPTDARTATARLYWGQSLVHLQDFDAARGQFSRFVADAPQHDDHALGLYRIGECSYFLADYARAEKELLTFLRQYGRNSLAEWALVYLGESQFRLNAADRAAKTFEAYRERYPNGNLIDDAEFGLARAYEVLQQYPQAIQLYKVIVARPNSQRAADAQFNLGARHFDDGEYAKAAEAFEAVVSKFPGHPLTEVSEVHAGYSEYHLEHFQEAIEHFQKAAGDPKHQDEAEYWIGLSYKSMQDYPRAAQVLKASLERKPDQQLAESLTFQWGDAELRQGNYAKSIDLFQQVATKWPQGSLADDALHSASEAALQMKDWTTAKSLHDQFIDQYPQSGLQLVQSLLYGRLLIAQGDATEDEAAAAKLFQQATEQLQAVASQSTIERTQNFARFHLARAYERLDQQQNVIEITEQLLKSSELSDAERSDILLLQANAYLSTENYAKSVTLYKQLTDLGDTAASQAAMTGLAKSYEATQDWEGLGKVLTDMWEQSQIDQTPRLALAAGDAAFNAKEWNWSEQYFQPVVNLGPASEFYAAALSGLAHAQYEGEKFAPAAASFQAIVDSKPDDVVLLSHASYMSALAQRRSGNLVGALMLYDQAAQDFSVKEIAELSPTDAEVGLNAYRAAKGGARVAREMQQVEDADRLYELAYQELRHLPDEEKKELDLLINEWADLSYNEENYARSDEIYALLVKECPASDLADDAQLILAESLRFDGKQEEAAQAFHSLADSKKSDEFVKQRSLVHLLDLAAEESNWEQVESLGQKLRTDFPQSSHNDYVIYRTGESQLQRGDFQAAVDVLSKLKDKFSTDIASAPEWWPEVWLMLGTAQYKLKMYTELEAVVADLRAKAPQSPIQYRADALLGQSFESRALFQEARTAYESVINSESGAGTETAAECQFRIAESYLKQKNFEKAIDEYNKVYAGYESATYEPVALFQAGRCYVSLKNWRQAVQTFQTLLDEFGESQYAMQAQAEIEKIRKAIPELNTDQPSTEKEAPAAAEPSEETVPPSGL